MTSALQGSPNGVVPIIYKGHINKHLSYRDLQTIAKEHNIPCNLKKDTMRLAIEAKINGNEELVNTILKGIKEKRLQRRRILIAKYAQFRELNLQSQSRSVCQVENKDNVTETNNNKSKFTIRDLLLQKMVNETSCKNVRICKTEVKAEFRHYEQPTISADCTMSSTSYCSPSPNVKNIATPRWPLPTVVSTGDSTFSSFMLPPTYSSRMVKSDVIMVSSTMPRQSGDIPQQSSRNDDCTRFSNVNGPQRKENTNINVMLEGVQEQHVPVDIAPRTNYTPQTVVHTLPPFEAIMGNRINAINSSSGMVGQESVRNDNENPLNSLADMVAYLDKDSQYFNRFISDTENVSNCSINRSELTIGGSKSIPQTIPTWNNFLEQRTGKCVQKGTKCKFGCHTVSMSSDQQHEHETNCNHQPFSCPVVSCQWVQQLGSLSTHILNFHNGNVYNQPESTYILSYGNDHSFNILYNPYPEEGPRRDTFFQLVNHRLFIVFVIGNFQNMQMCIYVQFVNDYNEYVSTGAIEILRPDGIPFQWVGKLFPVSFSSTRIISHRRCLIFNMNTIPRVQNFMIHVKIRNHKLVPVT